MTGRNCWELEGTWITQPAGTTACRNGNMEELEPAGRNEDTCSLVWAVGLRGHSRGKVTYTYMCIHLVITCTCREFPISWGIQLLWETECWHNRTTSIYLCIQTANGKKLMVKLQLSVCQVSSPFLLCTVVYVHVCTCMYMYMQVYLQYSATVNNIY